MIDKPRNAPLSLLVMESLFLRTDLSSTEQSYYCDLKKGSEGEQHFDELLNTAANEHTVTLHDLLFESNRTLFQIDTLLITGETVHLFEIKNYEGDQLFFEGKFFRMPKVEILNPLHQINRAESLFLRMMKKYGFSQNVQGHVIFVNPAFTLYQSPLNTPIIHPTQLHSFLAGISQPTTPLRSRDLKLADKLLSLHTSTPPLKGIPMYDFESLKKGVFCPACHSFSLYVEGHSCMCEVCGEIEPLKDMIVRMTVEVKTLFPKTKLTTERMDQWCNGMVSRKRIQKVLNEHFTKKGIKKGAYYE
ncbi:NERD domain-containing protein [Halobacillus litoralis]|uniref:nuclease-related domain-containing protein n=1 Tax=Halobacillus litoralis TaxID=45668 RepID=UPI001CD7D6EC|nr:nuclease-related domain-containing protein [Halobacillus litoralis]MCA0971305.1 NERD domain-containing protein [Halobacillus litoralis]